jgi:hypothetical protein
MLKKSQFEIWAQFKVSSKSVRDIHDFFIKEYNVHPDFLINNLHLTIYHSRRPMPDVVEMSKPCSFTLDTIESRFMVLAPGGENPRPHLIPGNRKVGIRIRKSSEFMNTIMAFRKEFFLFETEEILGSRKPSTKSRNAFGSRHFQPHISILKSGSGIQSNLSEIGECFRDIVQEIKFDKVIVQKVRNF